MITAMKTTILTMTTAIATALEYPYYARVIPEIRKHLPADVLPYLNLYPTYVEYVDAYAAKVPLDRPGVSCRRVRRSA